MTYRPHIDGLRAIAVLAVILFHFSTEALPGGFLGVDVFFVISGFLITQVLCARSDLTSMRRIGDFYLRRARRILPALLVTSLVTAAASVAIYLPNDLVRVGKYLFFTPLMLANAASASDGGYFAVAGAFLPLKHFWSLAVEEQFYLVYPLAIPFLFSKRGLKSQIATLAIGAAVSLVISIRGELRHSTLTFYLMPARAWELMFGALAALVPRRQLDCRVSREVTGFVCLGVVVASFFLFDDRTGFPHPYAMIPCAATAVLLFVGEDGSLTTLRVLSPPPLVFTGKVSYSLYLWHAPVLALTQYYLIRRLTAVELLWIWIGIYVLSALSWRFVEIPIRRRTILKGDRSFIVAALVSCTTVAVIGACLWAGDGLPWRFSRDIQNLTRSDTASPASARCLTLSLDKVAAGDLCHFGPNHPGVRKAILWGDSHALALLPAFEDLAESNDIQIEFAGKTSCRPLLGGDRFKSRAAQTECVAFNNAMISAIHRIRPSATILSAFWEVEKGYESRSPAGGGLNLVGSSSADWEKLLDQIRGTGSNVCVVLDVPHLPVVVPYALAMARRRGLDDSFVYARRDDVLAQYAEFEDPVRALEKVGDLVVVDPKDVLCNGARCEVELNGRSLYRDKNHLSRIGAMAVSSSLQKCLR
ncbi:MAG: acyltransferase [Proteobacteria bacterium]|nr:acyltransferase [Pseudomonadota bacterium]